MDKLKHKFMFATKIQAWGYQQIVKPIIFRRDPENVHDVFTFVGRVIGLVAPLRTLTRLNYRYDDPMLEQDILGIHFANPVGLSAGFDKNAQLPKVMEAVGFGFEEVGSITGEPCAGNPRPRLWRLPKSKGLVVYYGLKNEGALAIADRLKNTKFPLPVGISVAKTNDASTVDVQAGIADYVKAFRAFVDIGQYFTINISCPNTCGGEPFTTPERLELLMAELDKIATNKPIFLKMPADLTTGELDGLAEACKRHRVHGIILSNLTKKRDRPEIDQTEISGITKGGISGKPTSDASLALIEHLYKTTGNRFVIVGTGGIFTAEDAYEKIRRGASLVQMITGMIFQGPQVIGEINRGLAELLRRDGFKNMKEAVGSGVKM